ncbi:MAG TPA: chromosome segregation protein SMC, partial [Verrucomicrobiae bacterium]|nr:chromosome segregation protein SMC [Verrucomicrobiae bacterium]
MYLKRLEVHGFKSFADKVVLDFHPGLSVVVGPNGSGKSNISDSIRWVIGEQSAKSLRGAKMEDIIFAGSAKRRAIGMAEVSLTLDNSTGIFPLDFAEITVTRRLYRSGESEYLINKAPCRLKDVHELFMDTGIGRDGLSIIGQGRVEEILSSKPEDRRGLIEEAAGITKYRNRKREAARKLDETEQNLVRIADIVGELEVQLEPLKDQALKAETYQGLRHELDDLELNLAVHDIADLGGKLEACRGQIAELHNKLLASETEARVLEADNAAIKLALQALDEQIYQGQSACHNLSSQIQQLESELKLCDERTASIDGQHNRLNQETEEILQKAAGLQAEYAAEEAKVLILQQTRKELEAALQDKETRVTDFEKELGSAETRIEGLKDEIFELMSRNANLNNELTAATQKGEGYASRRNNLNEVVASRETELAEAKAGLENLQAELGITRDGINGNLFRAGQLKTEREGLEQRKTELQREAGRLNEQLQHATSRLKVLLDMQRDFEGYNRGVKEVLQAARDSKLRGIAGVVAELIQVPAHLETAVEVALGGSLQNVVSFLESDAKQAISFLKQNRFGRATFLPLDVLQPSPRSFDAKVLSAPGVLGVAADLVNYDRQFKPVAEYLLGRILVVENLERATQVAKLGGYKLRIVTVDGELLSPGGSLTGGSLQQRSSNLLGRNREITQLEEGVKSSREKLEGLRREEQGFINRIEEIEQSRLQILSAVKDLELKLVSLETERANLAREQTRLSQEISQFQLETSQIEAELSRLSSVQDELRRQREQVQAASDRANRDLGLAQ